MDKKLFKEFVECEVYAPYLKAKKRLTLLDKMWCKWISPESNAIYLLRKKQYYEDKGGVYVWGARMLHVKLMRRYGIHINKGTIIGKGLRIAHPTSIVITECQIGENFTIYQNCTIGQKYWHSGEVPTIGNNVVMYSGSAVIGDVTVADDIKIGAHACLVTDASEPGIYIGVPARRIQR